MRNEKVFDLLDELDDADFECIKAYQKKLKLTKKEADNDAFMAFMALMKDEERVFTKEEFVLLMERCMQANKRIGVFLREDGAYYGYVRNVSSMDMMSNMMGFMKDAVVDALGSIHDDDDEDYDDDDEDDDDDDFDDFDEDAFDRAMLAMLAEDDDEDDDDDDDDEDDDLEKEMDILDKLTWYVSCSDEVLSVLNLIRSRNEYVLNDRQAEILLNNPPAFARILVDDEDQYHTELDDDSVELFEEVLERDPEDIRQIHSWFVAVNFFVNNTYGSIREEHMNEILMSNPFLEDIMDDEEEKEAFMQGFADYISRTGYTLRNGVWESLKAKEFGVTTSMDFAARDFVCPSYQEIMDVSVYGYPKSNPAYLKIFAYMRNAISLKDTHEFMCKVYQGLVIGAYDEMSSEIHDEELQEYFFEAFLTTRCREYGGRTYDEFSEKD